MHNEYWESSYIILARHKSCNVTNAVPSTTDETLIMIFCWVHRLYVKLVYLSIRKHEKLYIITKLITQYLYNSFSWLLWIHLFSQTLIIVPYQFVIIMGIVVCFLSLLPYTYIFTFINWMTSFIISSLDRIFLKF